MGNWRTVNIIGSVSPADVTKLRDYLGYSHKDYKSEQWQHFGPLSFDRSQPSICGINMWPNVIVNVQGNLAERDYSPDDIVEQLQELVHVAPSMLLMVHCGGERESLECVATILVGEGLVRKAPPQVNIIAPMTDEQALINLIRALGG